MKVVVLGTPKLTAWGKFSLTIKDIKPSGEGSLKKSFELLRQKLDKEGLFEAARKRPLPYMPSQIAVISSPQAAGYADFIKILGDRWGGMRVLVAAVQVQGREAPDQIIRALNYFNALEDLPEMVVIIRGGGSADDLSAFNDEPLVRAIASSRVPTVVGVGHETDETLADMVADVRAATPSNAAQLIVPDKRVVIDNLYRELANLARGTVRQIDTQIDVLKSQLSFGIQAISTNFESISRELCYRIEVLDQLNPDLILKRGYAIARGTFAVGEKVEIEKSDMVVITEVKKVNAKN